MIQYNLQLNDRLVKCEVLRIVQSVQVPASATNTGSANLSL